MEERSRNDVVPATIFQNNPSVWTADDHTDIAPFNPSIVQPLHLKFGQELQWLNDCSDRLRREVLEFDPEVRQGAVPSVGSSTTIRVVHLFVVDPLRVDQS